MKEYMKVIMLIIVGIILVSSISVYATATYLYNATDVGYNNTSVSNALDDLYNISSKYKELTSTTSVTPNSLLSGYTAYNSDGTLITGGLSTDCVSGTYTKPANSQINIPLGFTPSRLEMYFMNSNSNGKMIVVYDSNIGYFYQIQHPNNEVTVTRSEIYEFVNNSIVSKYGTTNTDANSTYKNKITYYYVACK